MKLSGQLTDYQATQLLDALCVDEKSDVAEVALLMAAELGEAMVLAEQMTKIEALASEAALYVNPQQSPELIAKALCHFMKTVKGFLGNSEDYYQADNSFLNKVLERRLGIPISLAILYLGIARRLGVTNMVGVGFPGHFLVKIDADKPILIDPYFHKIIQEDECEERLQHVYGKHARLHRSHLHAVSSAELLARLSRNLVEIYSHRHAYEKALTACNRTIKLDADLPEDYYTRALLYEKLECATAAIQAYAEFIYRAPQDERIAEIKQRISKLRMQVSERKVLH